MIDKIQALISTEIPGAKPTPETEISELGDSLEITDLFMAVEVNFGVEIPEKDIKSIRTVAELSAYVEQRMGENNASYNL